MTKIIRVLVIDDSAFVRKVMRQMLSRSPFVEVVGAARDGLEGLEMVEQLAPDVVTLDLNMGVADGLTFLRNQMAIKPLPVIVVSMASKDGEQVIAALEAGAVDVVQKPTGLATDKILEIADELIRAVKAAAATTFRKPGLIVDTAAAGTALARGVANADILVLGISTGGPQALKYLIPRLPASFPIPLAIVLHMPIGYTELFARSLNEASSLEVVEAHNGLILRPGLVMLAPSGYHLKLARSESNNVVARLDLHPLDTPHRPAVDVLFRSAADIFSERTFGIVMTGMGADGTAGAAWIKAKGGRVFTEAEESCVVYGMPRSVVEAGLSDRSVALAQMAGAIMETI